MVQRLQNLLISLLFKLVDFPFNSESYSEKERAQIEQWMVACYSDPGYQKFFAYRNTKLVKSLVNGSGLGEEPRDKHVRVAGQRFEILRWNQLMQQVFEKNAKKQREKMKKEAVHSK